MGQRETQQNTRRRQRRSTKYPKQNDVHFRYNEFEQQVFENYKIDKDMENPKVTKILSGIIKDYHEMITIQKFCEEDPDLAIKIRKQKENQLLIDLLFDRCDLREIEAIKRACEDIIEIKNK